MISLGHREDAAQRLRGAESRTGCRLDLLLPFTMHAQDRIHNGQLQRWVGQLPMWLAIDHQHIWILNGRPIPAPQASREVRRALRNAPAIGSVWDTLPRTGLTLNSTVRWRAHTLELSWPRDLRLIAGELHGPAADREQLTGLLAGDELRSPFSRGHL
ncbi:MAG: hypothetical protein ACLP0J_24155 [Solirubrobacteraceae bacterium]